MKKVLLILVVILIITGCQDRLVEENSANNTSINATVEVYVVEITENNNEKTIEKGRLLFTDNDIKEYIWESHEIVFIDEFLEKQRKKGFKTEYDLADEGVKFVRGTPLLEEGGCYILGTSQREQFAVVVNDEIIYTGYFEQSLCSSFMPIGAVINDTKNGICIFYGGPEDDPRIDNRIKKLLEEKKLIN